MVVLMWYFSDAVTSFHCGFESHCQFLLVLEVYLTYDHFWCWVSHLQVGDNRTLTNGVEGEGIMEVMDKAMINMDTQHKLHMMLEHMDMEATQGMGIILTR